MTIKLQISEKIALEKVKMEISFEISLWKFKTFLSNFKS